MPYKRSYRAKPKSRKSRTKKSRSKTMTDKKQTKEIKTLTKRVSKLSRVNLDGSLIYRQRDVDRVVSVHNGSFHLDFSGVSNTRIETLLGHLEYYDPANPGTLVTADGTTGTFSKQFYVKRAYAKIMIRNNYVVPAKVTVYDLRVKEDTSIAPVTAYDNGLEDVGVSGHTSPLVYLTDSREFNRLWKIEKSMTRILNAGEQFSMAQPNKPFYYDPSIPDSHSLNWQRRHSGSAIVVRVEGVPAHHPSSDAQGTLGAGVDVVLDHTFEVNYDAGVKLKRVVILDNSDDVTSSGVVSNKPVTGQQVYSL